MCVRWAERGEETKKWVDKLATVYPYAHIGPIGVELLEPRVFGLISSCVCELGNIFANKLQIAIAFQCTQDLHDYEPKIENHVFLQIKLGKRVTDETKPIPNLQTHAYTRMA